MQTEIIADISDWFPNKQVNLSLFLPNWYCRKLGLTNLLGQDKNVTSNKKMTCQLYERSKSDNEDYCSHFSVTLETPSKLIIVFVTLILSKKVWRSYLARTGNWHQIWIWVEANFKGFKGTNRNSCDRLWLDFQSTIKFVIVSVRLISRKVKLDGFTGPWRKSDVR